jgi:hypothetical protein
MRTSLTCQPDKSRSGKRGFRSLPPRSAFATQDTASLRLGRSAMRTCLIVCLKARSADDAEHVDTYRLYVTTRSQRFLSRHFPPSSNENCRSLSCSIMRNKLKRAVAASGRIMTKAAHLVPRTMMRVVHPVPMNKVTGMIHAPIAGAPNLKNVRTEVPHFMTLGQVMEAVTPHLMPLGQLTE